MNFEDFFGQFQSAIKKAVSKKMCYVDVHAEGIASDRAFLNELNIWERRARIKNASKNGEWHLRGEKEDLRYLMDEFPQYFVKKPMTEEQAEKHFAKK